MIEPIQDYFIVEIESRYNEAKTKSGIILINTAWIDDGEMDRNNHKRIYGKVLAVPSSFSDTGFRAIDDGMPSYHKYVGHDDIVVRINEGYRNHAEKSYYPSTFEKYDVVTMADLSKMVDVEVGDKVYFMPQATEDENMLEKEKGREIYRICVTDLICVAREQDLDYVKNSDQLEWVDYMDGVSIPYSYFPKKIITQGEWVLIKPKMETWEEITTKSGIVIKPNPEKKWLEGIVAHSHHEHCKVGDHIVYLPNADAEVKVEDEDYFVMPVQDVIGKLK